MPPKVVVTDRVFWPNRISKYPVSFSYTRCRRLNFVDNRRFLSATVDTDWLLCLNCFSGYRVFVSVTDWFFWHLGNLYSFLRQPLFRQDKIFQYQNMWFLPSTVSAIDYLFMSKYFFKISVFRGIQWVSQIYFFSKYTVSVSYNRWHRLTFCDHFFSK